MTHEYGWQRDTPERRSGRPSGLQRRLQLSASDVHAMVEKEAESVARELAREPSLSLLALADARKEMDDIAMKAQVRTLAADLLCRRQIARALAAKIDRKSSLALEVYFALVYRDLAILHSRIVRFGQMAFCTTCCPNPLLPTVLDRRV